MPTLAEKLKGISSLPGAAVKSVRKKGPSAEGGVARSRRRGCKVFIISHSVNVSVTLTRCFRVWLVTSCSFFLFFFMLLIWAAKQSWSAVPSHRFHSNTFHLQQKENHNGWKSPSDIQWWNKSQIKKTKILASDWMQILQQCNDFIFINVLSKSVKVFAAALNCSG